MGILDGKRILVTGVLTDASLAFGIARLAMDEGAEVTLSGAGRGLSLTRRTARKLPGEVDVLEIDVTEPSSSPPRPSPWRRAGATSTASSTPSASRRPTASVGTS